MTSTSETELQQAYQGEALAARYVDQRFASELHRLLHDRQVAAVQQQMNRARPEKILEIAPGPGRLTRDLQPTGLLVCLEYNEGMIGHGRPACGERALWVRGNGFQLPFGECFDLVYSFRFVRHFRRADRQRLYGEIRRVLRPGGHFVMDAVQARLSKPLRDAHPEEYPIYDKLYQLSELGVELNQAGLELVQVQPVQKRYTWQYRSQVLLGQRANWLNRLVVRGLEALPGREGLEWIVTCRRV
jgi:ubiquinone/menaquinone biosynthesis C-methylase UbiE